MYGISWEVVYSRTGKEFMEKITEKHFEELEKKGVTGEEMQKARTEWASFNELYRNPFARFGMTLVEIFPVGNYHYVDQCRGVTKKRIPAGRT